MGCLYGNKGLNQSGRSTEWGKGPHGRKGGKSLLSQVTKGLDHTEGLCVDVWTVPKAHGVARAVLNTSFSSWQPGIRQPQGSTLVCVLEADPETRLPVRATYMGDEHRKHQ